MQTRFGIFSKIWLAMLGVVFAPLLIIWSLEHAQTVDNAKQLVKERHRATIDNLVTFVDGWVDMNLRVLNYNASLGALQSMEAERQTPLLQAIVKHYPWNYLAFSIDAYGRNVARSDGTQARDYRERGYVRQIRQGKPFASQVLIGRTSERLSLVLAVPVHAPQTAEVGPGVLGIAMSAEAVIARVHEARIGDSGRLLLIGESGQLIASPDVALDALIDFSDHPAYQAFQNQGEGNYAYLDSLGVAKLATLRQTQLGWLLVAEQDEAEAMRPVEEERRTAIFALLLGIPITALVAYFVSLRLARPIWQLIEAIREHDSGGLTGQRDVLKRSDEIGVLAREVDLSYEAQGLIQRLLHLSLQEQALEKVLEQSLELILKARWFRDQPRGGIWLMNSGQEMRLQVQHQLPEPLLEAGRQLTADSPLYLKACREQIQIESLSAEEDGEVRYLVPILSHQGAIGLLVLYQRRRGFSQETELNFLQSVARALGGVINRKRAESALANSQATLEEIIDNSSAIVSLKDDQGRYLLVNRKYQTVFKMAREAVMGRTDFECQSQVLARAWARTDRLVLESGQPLEYQEEFALENGHMSCLTVKFPLRDAQGKLYALCRISTDITRVKSIEQELRNLNAQLEERVQARTAELEASLHDLRQAQEQLIMSEKMAALGNLVVGVAHEINTPLGVCLTAASHLNDATDKLGDQYREKRLGRERLERYLAESREASDILVTNLKQASELVTSFKQIAVDQDTEEARSFDLRAYLEDSLLTLESQLKSRNIQVVFHGSEVVEIHSVPGAFAQILTHLVLNALTHAFKERSDGRIEIGLQRQPERLVWTFKDNGCGMQQTQLEHLFEPFFTTRRGQGGTGLGMHLVFNLVTQALGGRIDCQSGPGQGVLYIIEIPWLAISEQKLQARESS